MDLPLHRYRNPETGRLPDCFAGRHAGDRRARVRRHRRAFENRCVHRGALLAFEDGGNVEDFTCVYHNWRYDRCGNLKSIAFRRGIQGKGGMPADFDMNAYGPRKLRTEIVHGLVFGTLDQSVPSPRNSSARKSSAGLDASSASRWR